MGKKDPRVDAYIAKSADFAKPILNHLREVIHAGCPDVEETWKWSFPHFMYKGILCSMASFKQHCAFGFWKASLILGRHDDGKSKAENAKPADAKRANGKSNAAGGKSSNGKAAKTGTAAKTDNKEDDAMGQFGRLTSLSDLPPRRVLLGYVKEAMRLNDEGVKLPPRPKATEKEKKALVVPPQLAVALKKNKKAQTAFDAFSYSHKKEYIEWITDAKTEATRDKRLATTIEWLSEGKSRNWKYANC